MLDDVLDETHTPDDWKNDLIDLIRRKKEETEVLKKLRDQVTLTNTSISLESQENTLYDDETNNERNY